MLDAFKTVLSISKTSYKPKQPNHHLNYQCDDGEEVFAPNCTARDIPSALDELEKFVDWLKVNEPEQRHIYFNCYEQDDNIVYSVVAYKTPLKLIGTVHANLPL